MDPYRKILVLLYELLNQAGDAHWANWISKDIEEWDASGSTSHHRSAFGGMGSINDTYVGGWERTGTWKNKMFTILKALSVGLSKQHEASYTNDSTTIKGLLCEYCSYAEITEHDVEYFLSSRHLPQIIADKLETESFLDLLDTDTISNQHQIQKDRDLLFEAFKRNNFDYTIRIPSRNNALNAISNALPSTTGL